MKSKVAAIRVYSFLQGRAWERYRTALGLANVDAQPAPNALANALQAVKVYEYIGARIGRRR